MAHVLYNFNRPIGGHSGYVLMRTGMRQKLNPATLEYDLNEEEPYSVFIEAGEAAGPTYEYLYHRIEQEDDSIAYLRAPTLEEFGTADKFSYAYRKAVGQHPATLTELMGADRLATTNLEHCLRVVEFAAQNNCLDSLYKTLSNLACRDDQIPVLQYDNDRSFFWVMVSAEEHQLYKAAERTTNLYRPLPRPAGQPRYHGAIIAHQANDGSWDYACHT